jgi:flagellar assembly factor FliW
MESTMLPRADVRHFVDLPRFGPFHYTDAETISFPWGLPGFPALRSFVVLSVPQNERYIWLQSLDNLDIALPLVDPWSLFDDYAPPLPESAQRSLQIESASDFSLLSVVVTENGGNDTYVNLLAPIVINLRSKLGRQVLLEGTHYSVKTPVPKRSESDDEE